MAGEIEGRRDCRRLSAENMKLKSRPDVVVDHQPPDGSRPRGMGKRGIRLQRLGRTFHLWRRNEAGIEDEEVRIATWKEMAIDSTRSGFAKSEGRVGLDNEQR